MRIIAITLFILPLTGCGVSWFTEPKTNPVIEDRVGTPLYGEGELIGTLATTAERRIVLTSLKGANAGKFCAEPSPDTAESLLASFKASIDASATAKSSAQASLKGEFARSLATSFGALTRRTQGLQFYRDGAYALCQARMNGYIAPEEFVAQFNDLRQQSFRLISQEVGTANWGTAATVIVQAPNEAEDPKQP